MMHELSGNRWVPSADIEARTSEVLQRPHKYTVLMPYSQNIGTNGEQRLSTFSAFVVNAGVELYKNGATQKLVLCGESTFGKDYKSTNDLQREALIRMGVKEEDIIEMSGNLDNTPFQIEAVAKFQKDNGLSDESFLLLDWPFHEPRINNYMKGYGLNAETISAEAVHKHFRPKFDRETMYDALPMEDFEIREKGPGSLFARQLSEVDRIGLVHKAITTIRGGSVTDVQKDPTDTYIYPKTGKRKPRQRLINISGKQRIIEVNQTQRESAETPEHFDAIVVLGKNIGVDYPRARIRQTKGYLSPHSKLNVLAAGDLYAAGTTDRIIFSSGHTSGKNYPSEADAMKRFLLERFPEIPEEAIILEENSLDTWENAKEVKKVIKQNRFESVGLLTVEFHLERAAFLFASERIYAIPLSTDRVINDRKPKFAENYAKTRLVVREREKEKRALMVQMLPLGRQAVSIITHITRNPNK